MKTIISDRIRKDGCLAIHYEFIAETRAPRSMYNDYDGEAMEVEYKSENIISRLPQVGETYLVGINEYVGPNPPQVTMHLCVNQDKENLNEGWMGNSNPSIRRFHGWRGTNCDWSFHGYGVRKCINVKVTGNRSKKILVVFGKDKVADRA